VTGPDISLLASRGRTKLAHGTPAAIAWLARERLSLVGAAILLIYAIHRRDPIFTLAYLPNGFIYARNLYLSRRGAV
jgi:lipid-A-disaccharide synthase-like uncharacterized protein